MHKIHKIQKKANKSHINEGKIEWCYYGTWNIDPQECLFIILCASLLVATWMNILIIRKATRYIWRWESTATT